MNPGFTTTHRSVAKRCMTKSAADRLVIYPSIGIVPSMSTVLGIMGPLGLDVSSPQSCRECRWHFEMLVVAFLLVKPSSHM